MKSYRRISRLLVTRDNLHMMIVDFSYLMTGFTGFPFPINLQQSIRRGKASEIKTWPALKTPTLQAYQGHPPQISIEKNTMMTNPIF